MLRLSQGDRGMFTAFYSTPGYVSRDNSKPVTAICPTANTEESTGNRKAQSKKVEHFQTSTCRLQFHTPGIGHKLPNTHL